MIFNQYQAYREAINALQESNKRLTEALIEATKLSKARDYSELAAHTQDLDEQTEKLEKAPEDNLIPLEEADPQDLLNSVHGNQTTQNR